MIWDLKLLRIALFWFCGMSAAVVGLTLYDVGFTGLRFVGFQYPLGFLYFLDF